MSVITKEPSRELINLIKECGKVGTKFSDTIEKVKTRARGEGFTDKEILSLLRTHLKESLTPRQIKWIVIEKEQKTIKRQLELKNKENSKTIQLTTNATIKDAELVEPQIAKPQEITFEDTPESPQDLKATIQTQQNYIETLEHTVQEKTEAQRSKNRIRTKVVVSQLYREVLMMRNANALYASIIIDFSDVENPKYVKLEPV